MEFRLFCPSCGQKLKADEEDAGRRVDCPHCSVEFIVPHPEPVAPPPSLPAEPQRDSAIATPNSEGDLSCPVCWLRFDTGDVMHIAVHDSLRGDPLLGEDAQQRFLATRFNNAGQAIDAMGLPSLSVSGAKCQRADCRRAHEAGRGSDPGVTRITRINANFWRESFNRKIQEICEMRRGYLTGKLAGRWIPLGEIGQGNDGNDTLLFPDPLMTRL